MTNEQLEQMNKLLEDIHNQGYSSICFWMPCFNVSGGARYLYDLAKALAQNSDLNIYYMDYKGGFPSQLVQEGDGISLLEYREKDLEFPIKEPTIIFTNSTKVIQMKKMNPKNKFLFWHFETIPCGWHVVFFNNEEKKYIKSLKKHHALVYHDWSGRDSISNQFGIELDNKDYLQVYSKYHVDTQFETNKRDNEINIAWLSRLGAEKIYSLINIIDNFAKYKTTKIKRIHIIGDGLFKSTVEKYIKKYKTSIQFIFTGTIAHENLAEYLLKNADIVFAMGMSVVECASLKIPSAFVQLSMKKFEDDAYYWLYDTKEYCVGITTEEKQRFDATCHTMKELLDAISTPDGKHSIGEKCYEFFKNNYINFDDIVLKFLRYMKNTSLTYHDVKKYVKFMPYNIVEQIDYNIKKIRIYRRTKFANNIYYYIFGLLIGNVKLDENNRHIRWGFCKLPAIFPCLIKKYYQPINNEIVSEHKINFGCGLFIFINRNKRIQTYKIMGKKNILTKRYNIGYKFPTSLFKG